MKIKYLFAAAVLLFACSNAEKITEGKTVKMDYTITLENGEKYESSVDTKKPLEFVAGNKMIIKGLEESLYGLKVGDKRKVSLAKEQAYGNYNDKLVFEYSRNIVPENYDLEPGKTIMAKKDGKNYAARIKSFNDKSVFIDFNHPLAGKNLVFDVKILEIN